MDVLKISAKSAGDHVVVTLDGALNTASFDDLDKSFATLFKKGFHRLIINLEKLTYVSSAGIGVFIGYQPMAQESGGNIVLMKPIESVREVFDLLGLTDICAVVNTYDEAKAEMAKAGGSGGVVE
ncbi:anti-sigma factor antagonist [Planctomycetales bacterium]|jgi:anti-sigma B factor antagonist|nr:STAS domain-containing protein [Planctomycetota bacterium]GHS91358.1 anti-sigma factor antagonist [Planctomycetales bacterium]GHS98910.1 anti-sigma factor antagonist [Planctomycetales bacterium]GHT07412.1 anti-sigma factor antagonist [Planctomycetales bacterium]GHV18590.1 anti-sigma factor antagonist [Planctomycetales bacterium]